MIQTGTYLKILDNSGAKDIACIKVAKGYKRKYAFIGDVITGSIKNIRKNKKHNTKVKKGEVVKAVVVKTSFRLISKFNEHFKFFDNSAVLINKQHKLLGTRVFGAVLKKFKYTKYLRISTLASGHIF